ncbi:MAG TPA: hypothetical protein VF731_09775 [Solirubrobacterales bacterium]
MSAPAADPYEELADLAEAALELAEQDRVHDLAEIFARSSELTATLHHRPPASARPALERAAAAQQRLQDQLGSALLAARTELDHVSRGRRAARAYGVAAPKALDLQA